MCEYVNRLERESDATDAGGPGLELRPLERELAQEETDRAGFLDSGGQGKGRSRDETRRYFRGNAPAALRSAARELLDAGDVEGVGLREVARSVGMTVSSVYRYFENKDDCLAAVAADGFRELTVALRAATGGPDAAVAVGLAYLEFALTKRALFRLMFGPLLLQKNKYPVLDLAVTEAREVIAGLGGIGNEPEARDTMLATWSLIHGLSALFIGNMLPEANVRALAQTIFAAEARHDAPST
jgi:AcrR family transcriptional regulator